MLARLLLSSPSFSSSNLSMTIFESELSIDVRSQGGTLDLHEKTGLAAIKKAGLWDGFAKKSRYDGAALKILDKHGKEYLGLSAEKNGKPEIDRVELRRLLLESLPGEVVQGGKKLLRIEGDGEVKLCFEDGSVESGFDLIVGADGAWSRVRRFLDPETTPSYAGIMRAWTQIPDAATTAPQANAFVARGSVFAFSDGKSIMGQQIGDGSIQVAALQVTELDEKISTVRVGEMLSHFEGWAPELLDLLEKCEHKMAIKPLYELPVGYTWPHTPHVTLLGDAAHLMTPFAGEGVNLAFADAMDLSHAILQGIEDGGLDKNVKAYEEGLWKRSAKAMAMTSGMKGDMFFTAGAPRTSIHRFVVRRLSYDMPAVLYPLLVGGIYGMYFLWRVVS